METETETETEYVTFWHRLREEWCQARVVPEREYIDLLRTRSIEKCEFHYPRVCRRHYDNTLEFLISDRTVHNIDKAGMMSTNNTVRP